METVETATEKTWEDDLMKGPNGEVVMSDVMKNQETTSSDMPVSCLHITALKENIIDIIVVLPECCVSFTLFNIIVRIVFRPRF